MIGILDVVASVAGDVDRATALRALVRGAVTSTSAARAVLELVDEHDRAVETWTAGVAEDGPVALTCEVGGHARHWGALRLTGADAWSAEDRRVAATIADAVALVLDVDRTHRLLERRRVWLEASSALLERAASPFRLERALQEITTRAAAVSGAAGVAVLQLDAEAEQEPRSAVVASCGLEDPQVVAAVDEAAHWLGRHGVPLTDLEIPGELVTVLVPMRSLVATPGVLVLVHRDVQMARDVDERALLGGFADQAGLALDRAQAVRDRGRLDDISARDRASRDLHDVVLQRLFATGMQLHAVRMTSDAETGARIDEVVDALDTTIRDIRSSIFSTR